MSELELYNELVHNFKNFDLELSKDLNGYSFTYNEKIDNMIAKLLNDLYLLEGCNILLQNKNGEARFSISTNNNEMLTIVLLDKIEKSYNSYIDEIDYITSMDEDISLIYNTFKSSFLYKGNFGIGIQNIPSKKKYIIKTDMVEMLKNLEMFGFEIQDNKVIVPESEKERFFEMLERVNEKLNNKQTEEEDNLLSDDGEEKNDNSEVDFYEKVVTTAAGLNAIVRLSVVKQNKDESGYDRLVNISYIDKNAGTLTSNEVFGYENGYQFDKDVLPSIIDGFKKNFVSSGKEVDVNEIDSTKCYLSSLDNENDIYLEGYNVNDVKSLLDYDKEHNLVGDEQGRIDLNQLTDDGVIKKSELEGDTFEEQVADIKLDNDISEDNSLSNDGVKMVKKLGEMPTNNYYGFSNYIGIALFLAIDVVAIIVGIFLLIN